VSGRRPFLIAALATALFAPALVQAQESDLVTASEKEKERRKKSKGTTTTTYTDKDLPAPTGTEAPKAGTNANASPSPSPPAAGETRAAPKDETYWRNRTKSLREAIAAAEARVQKAEEDYAASRRPGSQPLPTDVVGPEGGLAQLPADPAFNPAALKLQKELDDAKAALAAAQKALEDFEEEARKAGVPAGWLR
jgi:hypothetical protein